MSHRDVKVVLKQSVFCDFAFCGKCAGMWLNVNERGKNGKIKQAKI